MATVQGWVASGFEAVQSAFEQNFERGLEVGAAYAAYHRGRKVVDLWGGIADLETGRPWFEDTLCLVYSTTKGVTTMCAQRLIDQGLLDPDALVSEYWPEFKQSGKESVTVAQLMSHRAGVPWVEGDYTVDDLAAWTPVIEGLERKSPEWEPGTAHGYHATTFGWLVGELVRRVSGVSVGTYLRQEIAGPLGADFYIGLPAELEERVASLIPMDMSFATGDGLLDIKDPDPDTAALIAMLAPYMGREGPLVKALTAPNGAFSEDLLQWNSPSLHSPEIPAANGICDARSLALLYGACVSDVEAPGGSHERIISAATLDRALIQQTEGPDRVLLGLDIQWGLGFMLNTGLIGMTQMGGPRLFGHFGMGGSVGFCDPDLELGMGYIMNKMEIGTTGDPRSFDLIRATCEAASAL